MSRTKLPGVSKRGSRFVNESLLTAETKNNILIASNATAAMSRKAFQDYCSMVIQEIRRLGDYTNTPNVNSIQKDFDTDKHPHQSAKEFYDSWH